MNGADIKNYIFSSSVFGFKKSDVINCLKEISEYVVSIEQKLSELKDENKKFEEQIVKYKTDQDSFKEIVTSAQQYKRKVVDESKAKSEQILLEASSKAENLIKDAENRTAESVRKLRLIESEVSSFKDKLVAAYKAHIEVITKIPERVGSEKFSFDEFDKMIGQKAGLNEEKVGSGFEAAEDVLVKDVLSSSEGNVH